MWDRGMVRVTVGMVKPNPVNRNPVLSVSLREPNGSLPERRAALRAQAYDASASLRCE